MEQGRDPALQTDERFEGWARHDLYGRREQNAPMQKVKSRVMHGASISLGESFVMLLIAVRADYRFGNSGPFRRASTGPALPSLMYAKALWCLLVGCFALYAWFRKHLLRKDVCQAYATLRIVDWCLSFWLFVALFKDFGDSPWDRSSSIRASERTLFFFALAICTFSLVNIVLNLRKLRIEWRRFRLSAFVQYREETRDLHKQIDVSGLVDVRSGPAATSAEVVPLPTETYHALPAPGPWASGGAGAESQVEISLDDSFYAGGRQNWSVSTGTDIEPFFSSGGSIHGTHTGHPFGPSHHEPIAYFEMASNEMQTARTVGDVPTLDMFARISHDEFILRWEGMAESGNFERHIARVPSADQMRAHLGPRGFQLVAADDIDLGGFLATRMYVYAQSQGAVFLVEFVFDVQNLHIQATFKSQDDDKTHNFVSLLALQDVLY